MPDLRLPMRAFLRHRFSKWTWTRSLRFQLTAWYTGILALLLILAGSLFYLGAKQALRTAADGFLANEAHSMVLLMASDRSGKPLGPDDLAQALVSRRLAHPSGGTDTVPHGLRSNSLLLFDVVYARLVLRSGLPLFQSADLAVQPALAASLEPLLQKPVPAAGRFAFAGPDEERLMRVLTLPVEVGSRMEMLQVAVPWDHNADVLEHLGETLVLGLLIVLSCAAVGGWILVERTLQPIGRIVLEADRLDAMALPEALLPRAIETDGEIGLLVATLNRMTLRLRLAFEAQHRFAEAQERFAADASHELRTPLTILRGELDLALARPREAAAYRATIASAVEEVARMSRTVESLSFLSRQDADHMGLPRCEPVDLPLLCQAVVNETQYIALKKQVEINAKGDASLTVLGDADQFQELLRNLVDNALKYTAPGGRVCVEYRKAADGAVALTVSDTGIGIATEDLPSVFERFWRADRSRTGEGSGLGLAICRRIAEMHGATLMVESQPGTGSIFTFRLPPGRIGQ